MSMSKNDIKNAFLLDELFWETSKLHNSVRLFAPKTEICSFAPRRPARSCNRGPSQFQ